jgi:dihydroorotate dehydrogenase (fumarate)
MLDLSTRYLGLDLRSPIVASASPLTDKPDTARRLEDAGAAALVLQSLFAEDVPAVQNDPASSGESRSGRTGTPDLPVVARDYLNRLEALKRRCSVPVIASLNAGGPGTWARCARWLADAGADALELNLYHVVADPLLTGVDLEAADLEAVAAVRQEVSLPLAVKLSPFYSAMANFAARVVDAGADGLVLFNRFYQPDIDVETREVTPRLELSRPPELRLPLRWIAILRPQLRPGVSLAATTGIATGTDVVKALMVGADVAMVTSALLRHGPAHLGNMEAELHAWLDEHRVDSLGLVRGSASHGKSRDPSAFERGNYREMLRGWAPGLS